MVDPAVAKVVRAGMTGWLDLITGLARKAGREFGGFGPLTAEEVGSLVGSAFIGAESHYLLGFEKQGCRFARRFGASANSFASRKVVQRPGDIMRAKLPVQDGFVERDGVKLYYEVYGNGPQTMVFVPPWSIVHSRVYKAQLPYFSERFRCVTYEAAAMGNRIGRLTWRLIV